MQTRKQAQRLASKVPVKEVPKAKEQFSLYYTSSKHTSSVFGHKKTDMRVCMSVMLFIPTNTTEKRAESYTEFSYDESHWPTGFLCFEQSRHTSSAWWLVSREEV